MTIVLFSPSHHLWTIPHWPMYFTPNQPPLFVHSCRWGRELKWLLPQFIFIFTPSPFKRMKKRKELWDEIEAKCRYSWWYKGLTFERKWTLRKKVFYIVNLLEFKQDSKSKVISKSLWQMWGMFWGEETQKRQLRNCFYWLQLEGDSWRFGGLPKILHKLFCVTGNSFVILWIVY